MPFSSSRKRSRSPVDDMTIPWPPEAPAKRRELKRPASASPPRCLSPSPPLRVTIDHRAFPHIMAGVLSFANKGALLAIRGTCRAYRTEVDSRLFQHVVVGSDYTTSDQGLYVTVPGPRGSSKPKLRWRAGETPPSQIFSARIVSITNVEMWESNLYSSKCGTDLVSALVKHMPEVETLRLSNTQMHLRYSKFLASAPRARTVVCIGAIARDDPCSPSRNSGGFWVEAPTLPIGVKRFVLTIPYKPFFAYRQDLIGLFGSPVPTLREAVIILANANIPHFKQPQGRQRRSARLTPASVYSARLPNFSFLRTVIGEIKRSDRRIRWTLVGVTAFLDEMDCTPTPSREEFEAYIDTRLEEDWRKRVTILEPAEYARRIGDRQFELETRHPEDEGVRGRCGQLSW